MKKAVLATAVVAALISGSTFAATVYDNEGTKISVGGRAVGLVEFSDSHKTDAVDANSYADESYARISFSGKSEIDESTYAFGKYEVAMGNDKNVMVENRYQYAGLGFANFGELSFGRQDSSQQLVADFTDVFNEFSGAAADLISANKSKQSSNLVYTGKFDALTLQANYILSSTKDDDSYGVAAVYKISDAVKLGAGYTDQNGSTTNNQFNVAGEYKVDALTLSALVLSGKQEDKSADGYEVAAKYKLGKTTVGAGYEKQTVNSADTQDFVVTEVEYKFNGNARVYADYKLNQMTGGEDALRLGLRFDF